MTSRIRFFLFFLKNPKKLDFLRFLKRHLKKRTCREHNPKFEVSDFADFSLHGISTTVLKQCRGLCLKYMALVVA